MIAHTFCHLPGIGEATERRLWDDGLVDWPAAMASDRCLARVGRLADRVAESTAALAEREFGYFDRIVSGRQAWRWFGTLRGRVAYVDLETTGLDVNPDAVTVIALYDGRRVRCYVRGDNLNDFAADIEDFDLMVTFNGATFDVPMLRATFRLLHLPPVHLDLRYPLKRLGYAGGLKSIERATGLARDEELADIDGYMAVLLWRRHLRGDRRALPTLLRYAAEDVVGLEPLAELVYNRHLDRLPVRVAAVGPTPRLELDWPFHPALLRELGPRQPDWE